MWDSFLVNSGDKGKGGSVLGTNKLPMAMAKPRPQGQWYVGESELNTDCADKDQGKKPKSVCRAGRMVPLI